ncbi:MAG: ParB N-terminal domain-containing protein [Candidatus Marinimicrobia bacterium]|nr:ParB N-terminal domain-containing protein [Candidatus Neomarinimicrobiota bacterium]
MELKEVNPKDLVPNDWNPNVLSELKYKALKNSIKEFPEILEGQRVIVRQHPVKKDKYEILNGEHRWRIASELKFKTIPIGAIIEPNDNKAKLISLALANVGEEEYDRKLGVINSIQKELDLTYIANLIGEDANTLMTLIDEMNISTESLAEVFEKYESSDDSSGEEEKVEDYFDILDINPSEAIKTEIPSVIKVSVSGYIRKALQKGLEGGYETTQSIIEKSCKLFVEQDTQSVIEKSSKLLGEEKR